MSAFLDALRARAGAGFVPVIPDMKMISPAEGPLFAQRDPAEAAKALVKAGAPVLSVVTEDRHFGGSMALLRSIIREAGVPVLRKDFIQSAADVEATAACGASAVLLICAAMPEDLLRECFAAARDLGLDALVEACPEAEICVESVLPVGEDLDPDGSLNDAVRRFNAALAPLAREKGCGFADIYAVYEKDGALDPALTRDGIHLNFTAYGPWAECIAQLINADN